MATEFVATREPSSERCERIAALARDNPFWTHAYARARHALGDEVWAFELGACGEPRFACTGFLRAGRLRRILEIPSVPPVARENPFWSELLGFCRARGVSELTLGSFASPRSLVPVLAGEVDRCARREFVLELQQPGLWQGLSSNHARNWKRGHKAGLELSRGAGPKAMVVHAELIGASLDRRRQRAEAVEAGGTGEEASTLERAGAATLFQAVADGAVLSSILVLRAERGGYYHSAGTSPHGMACGASHFLVRETAEALRAEGSERFNLGGVRAGSDGLERFKAGFGAVPRELEAVHLELGGGLRRCVLSLAKWLRAAR